MVNLQGCSLAGSSLTRERVKNDYYATPYESIKSLLEINLQTWPMKFKQ